MSRVSCNCTYTWCIHFSCTAGISCTCTSVVMYHSTTAVMYGSTTAVMYRQLYMYFSGDVPQCNCSDVPPVVHVLQWCTPTAVPCYVSRCAGDARQYNCSDVRQYNCSDVRQCNCSDVPPVAHVLHCCALLCKQRVMHTNPHQDMSKV
jgi:hypothetical protein